MKDIIFLRKIFFFFSLSVSVNLFAQVLKMPGTPPPSYKFSKDIYVEPQTPTAASLGKYGDFPISYFTGTANVSIPIYSLSSRNLILPITLDYETSGVLVNNLPTWAGQNWTLNVGGVITRAQHGQPDEFKYSSSAVNVDYLNQRKNYFEAYYILPTFLNKNDDYALVKNNANSNLAPIKDLAPDIFSFHFLDKFGKFFLGNDGNWKVQSDDNLEIIFDYKDASNFSAPFIADFPRGGSQPKTIYGFKIRDDQGNIYQFGYDINAIEYNTDFWHMNTEYNEKQYSWNAMSWYLTRVTDKFGNELFNLKYNRGAYLMQMFLSYYRREPFTSGVNSHMRISASGDIAENSNFPYTISISSPVYLTEINNSNTSIRFKSSYVSDNLATEKIYESFCKKYLNVVDAVLAKYNADYNKICYYNYSGTSKDPATYFYYLLNPNTELNKYRYQPASKPFDRRDILGKTRMKQLDYISIKSGNESPRYIKFNHKDINNRLCLEGISMQTDSLDSKAKIVNTYKFKYNNFEKLPSDYLTTEIDHWGYYNGRSYYDIVYGTLNNPEITRNPVFPYSKYGSLSEIIYPTGGSTLFEYEQNTYSKVQSLDRSSMTYENGIGGGLRLKSIFQYNDANHTKLLKHIDYSYNKPGSSLSSGELFAKPKYTWGETLPCEDPNTSYVLFMTQGSSIIPLANTFGPSLGYSYVTENVKQVEGGSQIVRSTLYQYSNLSTSSIRDEKMNVLYKNYNGPTPYDEYSSLAFMRGKLLKKTIIEESDTIDIEEYEYRSKDCINNHSVYTSNVVFGPYNGLYTAHFEGGIYKLYFPKYDIIREIKRTRTSDGRYTKLVTDYNKSDFNVSGGKAEIRLCTLVTTSNVNNTKILESQTEKYSYDLNNSYFVKDFFFPVVQTEKYWNGNRIETIHTYYSLRSFQNSSHLVPSVRNYALGTDFPYTGDGRSGYTAVKFDSYNQKGDLTQFTIPGQASTYLTWDKSGNLSSKKVGNQITKYTYKISGLLESITSPNNNKTTYYYDTFDRLSYMKDNANNIIQKYNYNYRNNPYSEEISENTSDTSGESGVANPAQEITSRYASITLFSSMSKTSEQVQFEIKWAQDVKINVVVSTTRPSTSAWAIIRKVSSNGTNINEIYMCTSNKELYDKSYTVHLEPGTYMIAAQLPYYGESSTRAIISASYKTYK